MTLSVCKDAFEATVLTQTRWSALLAILGPVIHSGSLKKLLVNDLLNLLVNIQPILLHLNLICGLKHKVSHNKKYVIFIDKPRF